MSNRRPIFLGLFGKIRKSAFEVRILSRRRVERLRFRWILYAYHVISVYCDALYALPVSDIRFLVIAFSFFFLFFFSFLFH